MTIDRRTAFRQLALLSVGAALLPSCLSDHAKPDLVLQHFTVSSDQQKLLAALTAALIPSTSTPGANEVAASLFVLKMMNDCSPKADQDKFFKGMQQLDDAARSAAGKSFAAASPAQQQSLLQDIAGGKQPAEELNFFYGITKKWTILAYSSSEYYLTKVQPYELVPGRFHGCVPA